MKITISDDRREASVKSDSEVIDDVMEDIKGLLIAWGFHPETVEEYFNV